MKTLIIIRREYLTRVRKRSFIILTLLIPVLFIGLGALVAGIAVNSSDKKTIAVLDESKMFENKLENSKHLAFRFEHIPLDSLRRNLKQKGYDAVLYIPVFDKSQKADFKLYADDQVGIEAESRIKDNLNEILVQQRMLEAGIDQEKLKIIEANNISVKTIDNKEEKESSNLSALGIGYGCGLLLYMFMLFYGMSVMRSVMEEKTNRIAEIIVSSVKPFQLMLGKIIGVALVGLTQFLIWIVLFLVVGGSVLGGLGMQAADPAAMGQAGGAGSIASDISAMLNSTNWLEISLWFLFYFLGGYFLYAALFAAVGSLVNEDPQESNQYTLPITIPIILGFVIMSSAIRNPNSSLAVFGSIFPLTSPIVMMARIPFGVPAWQLIASALLLVLGFLGTTWMAGKIYRTGILLYGKKVTLKEVGKWILK
jgi:ABC-2 type transport system permease protein